MVEDARGIIHKGYYLKLIFFKILIKMKGINRFNRSHLNNMTVPGGLID